ncbi:hypothetical protein B0H17DRAFT_1135395 [Mycena rosella]|uniref:DUF6535 domain-containing protein n=1 Tax=Mycena rosella TaxID=1033263 RepID=A0AAD7DD64_MYCRO|nr:hypothetical protein B0H17DRAFT_1135395 [Mycena rosella]
MDVDGDVLSGLLDADKDTYEAEAVRDMESRMYTPMRARSDACGLGGMDADMVRTAQPVEKVSFVSRQRVTVASRVRRSRMLSVPSRASFPSSMSAQLAPPSICLLRTWHARPRIDPRPVRSWMTATARAHLVTYALDVCSGAIWGTLGPSEFVRRSSGDTLALLVFRLRARILRLRGIFGSKASLFSTLLAGLLAVLGKQWLLHYDSVGERGTLEDRGLERQRKFDSLLHWKFDLVMQTFPLLLQLALLLFAAALSIYLWTIHHVVAAIVLGLTSIGVVLYILMVVSALAFPDSPFQTPLTTLLMALLKADSPPDFAAAHLFGELPPPSKEIPAIVWALETSTDPKIVDAAVALVLDVQWPVNLDLRRPLIRLADIFNGCFTGSHILDGMDERAIRCIRAFGLLEMVTERQEDWTDPWTFEYGSQIAADSELRSMAKFFRLSELDRSEPDSLAITRCSLCFLPGQVLNENYLEIILGHFQPDAASIDRSLYADLVFCINSCFARPSIHDLSRMDKSDHCVLLTTLLVENLAGRLNDTEPLELKIARKIIDKIAGFTVSSGILGKDIRSRDAVHRFCAIPDLRIRTIASALRLARLEQFALDDTAPELNHMADVAWVYSTLEELHVSRPSDTTLITDLLQVLVHHGSVPTKPSVAALNVILWGISFDVAGATAYLALIFPHVHQWVQDGELRPVLKDRLIWALLGEAINGAEAQLYPSSVQRMVASYISLGDKLSQTPEWKPVIAEDLLRWLANLSILLSNNGNEHTKLEFCAVLSRIWNIVPTKPKPAEDPECLAMGFQVLTSTWDQLEFSELEETSRLVTLIKCSISEAFCSRITEGGDLINTSDQFKEIMMPRLADAIERAAEHLKQVQNTLTTDQDSLTGAAGLMLTLASTINGELKQEPPAEYNSADERWDYWYDLRRGLQDAFQALSKTPHAMSILGY